ncbi:MAG: hypothetical protein LWX56_10050 [Ignavibacteria bacterium]|nr:hypothetical protein [Ignavibacteria bacterium]
MIEFTVHVEYEDGSNAANVSVFLDIHSWPASTWLKGYTNDAGDVSFELEEELEITFHVDGEEYQTETVHDGDCVYITL